MADEQPTNGKERDPVSAFREMRDSYLDTLAKAMIDAVNTDAYAKATGAMLETYLAASSPFKDALEKAMLQTLQHLSMPSRADFISLAERATNIEMRLDDMDAKLDRIEKAIALRQRTRAPGAVARPRSRKGKR